MTNEEAERIICDPKLHYAYVWGQIEPKEFADWFESTHGKPSEFGGRLGEMPGYWVERGVAIGAWMAAKNPHLSWAQVLRVCGYSERAERLVGAEA